MRQNLNIVSFQFT